MNERYRILEQIGEGGLGSVYRAHDTQLDREVAIKRVLARSDVSSEETFASLQAEAKTLSALKHPNIVTVHDVGVDEEGPFIVMELLEGETLDEIIERGALPLEDFQALAMQTLEALVAAEAQGLLHRDLKPANIMIVWLPSGRFQVKVLDFGLASFSEVPVIQTMDHGGSILGSIYFMAPEQFESLPLDARSDLYSLGAIFYYALTGCYAFGGENPGVVMEAHLSHSFVPLAELRPDLPAAVCTWVERLFSRRMEDRPASAREALISWSLEAVIDEVQLREAASDDPEIAEELLDSFVEEMSDFWGQLEAGLERRDGAAIVDLARSIRGSAATLGYVEIVSITRKIEKNATDNPADCAAVCAGFGPALDRLRDTIGRMAWQAGDGGQEGGEIT